MLEFKPTDKELNGCISHLQIYRTHLDLFVQKSDNHAAVPNAKVTAQVQLPNGKQQTLALKYDADGKHYTVLFPVKTAGQYPVKMTADINGEKVNGRFTFNQ